MQKHHYTRQEIEFVFENLRKHTSYSEFCKVFNLMCNVDSITVTKDKALLVRVQDEHYNQRLEEQYECTGGWKVSDPKTRPFKFSNEMEDWEYHG